MPDFEDSLAFSGKARHLWAEYLHAYFAEIEIMMDREDDERYWRSGWDWVLVFRGSQPPLRIEFKSCTERAYRKYFLESRKFAIETHANVEGGKLGSSIYNSNAELWAYGYIKSDFTKILEARIWWRKPFSEWLKQNEFRYEKRRTNTEGLYHTEFVLVPTEEIDPFIFQRDYTEALA